MEALKKEKDFDDARTEGGFHNKSKKSTSKPRAAKSEAGFFNEGELGGGWGAEEWDSPRSAGRSPPSPSKPIPRSPPAPAPAPMRSSPSPRTAPVPGPSSPAAPRKEPSLRSMGSQRSRAEAQARAQAELDAQAQANAEAQAQAQAQAQARATRAPEDTPSSMAQEPPTSSPEKS